MHVKMFNPPGSEVSREVANLTWIKSHVQAPKTVFLNFLASILMNSKMETISKKFSNFGCHSSFCKPIFAPKTAIFRLWTKKTTQTHTIRRGGMKFATQISPLFYYYFIFCTWKLSLQSGQDVTLVKQVSQSRWSLEQDWTCNPDCGTSMLWGGSQFN